MILEKEKVQIETSQDFKKQAFRIDPRQMNKMMWLTINQYEHKIRTSVQEVICNGRDAQREAGNPDTPLKIVLPTKLEPTFKVRDYGVGINPERMNDIFTSFGASTKNSSNLQTGGFGIGAKSPLCYTGQFNVVTYVDGKYWAYVVSKNEDGGIDLIEIGKGDTLEPNGTEVQIPVAMQDVKEFIKAACRATMFWDVQPTFNLSEESLYIINGGLKINDDITIYKGEIREMFDSYGVVYVIDGIPYAVDKYKGSNVRKYVKYNSTLVVKLNTGDVKVLQTREALDYNDFTNNALLKIANKVNKEIEKFQENYYTVTDLKGRFNQYITLSNMLDVPSEHVFGEFKFNDTNIYTKKVKLSIKQYDYFQKYSNRNKKQTMNKNDVNSNYFSDKTSRYKTSMLDNLFIDDLGDKESSIIKNRRIKKALETQDYVYVIDKDNSIKSDCTYICKHFEAKKLSSLPLPPKKVKTKTTSNGVVKNKQDFQYDRYEVSGVGYYCTKLHKTSTWRNLPQFTKTPVIYFVKDSYKPNTSFVKYVQDLGYTLIGASNKTIKIIKDLPNTIDLNSYKKAWKPSKAQINQYMANTCETTNKQERFVCVNITEIKNKKLTQLAKNVNLYTGQKEETPYFLRVELNKRFEDAIKKENANRKLLQDFIKKNYGVLELISDFSNKDTITEYLNKGE